MCPETEGPWVRYEDVAALLSQPEHQGGAVEVAKAAVLAAEGQPELTAEEQERFDRRTRTAIAAVFGKLRSEPIRLAAFEALVEAKIIASQGEAGDEAAEEYLWLIVDACIDGAAKHLAIEGDDCERCKGSGIELRQGYGEWLSEPCPECNGTGHEQPEGGDEEDWPRLPIARDSDGALEELAEEFDCEANYAPGYTRWVLQCAARKAREKAAKLKQGGDRGQN